MLKEFFHTETGIYVKKYRQPKPSKHFFPLFFNLFKRQSSKKKTKDNHLFKAGVHNIYNTRETNDKTGDRSGEEHIATRFLYYKYYTD